MTKIGLVTQEVNVNIKFFHQTVIKLLNPVENHMLIVEMQLAMGIKMLHST